MHSATEYGAQQAARARSRRLAHHLTPRSPFFYLLALPAVAATIGILIPFVIMIYYSLTNKQLSPFPYHWVGLDNYVFAFGESEFWHALSVTILYAVLACLVEVPLGVLVAWGLNHDFWGVKVLRVAVIIPMMIPPVIGSLIWKMMLNPTTGVLTFFLNVIGVRNFSGFAAANTALPTIIVVDVWLFTPFIVLIVLAALRSVPDDFLEAAAIDGASAWCTFQHIVLPLISPYILLVTLFRAIDSLKTFDTIYATAGGGPVTATMNFTLESYIRTFQWHQVGSGLVYMVVLWAIIFVASQFMMRLWNSTLTMR